MAPAPSPAWRTQHAALRSPGSDPSAPTGADRKSTSVGRVARRIALGAAVVIVVIGLGTLHDLSRIHGDLDAGRHRLEGLDLATLRAEGLEPALHRAAQSLRAASARAEDSPFLALSGTLPVLGDQVDAVRDLTAAAAELGSEAERSGATVAAALDRADAGGRARIDLLDTVVQELRRMETVTAGVDVGARGRLLPPLASARRDLERSIAEVPDRLAPLEEQIAALRQLLVGPTAYLVMVGNNAEMRAGAGMPLQIGQAGFFDGDIELGEFKPATSEVFTDHPTGEFNAHIPDDLTTMYPRWSIGEQFPETAVVPDFPRTAPIYADIARDAQGWISHGAVHIDAIALASLLEVVGPITIGGVEYNSATAPQLVLNQTYFDYDGVSRRHRRDAQSELARAMFEAIEERDVDLLDVLDALQTAAEGRHLMLWSPDPVLQDLYRSFGADGAINPYQTLVSLQNTAANKLDWYIRPAVDVTAEPLSNDQWQVTLTTTIVHPDREPTVDYIEGIDLPDGTHRALLTVQVPRFAEGLGMPGEVVTELGDDGTSKVVGTRFTIPRGETRVVETRFRLPRALGFLAVAPSARAVPVPWTVEGVRYDDDAPFVASFGPFPEGPRDRAWQAFALAGVLVALTGTVTVGKGARRPQVDERQHALARIDHLTGAALLVVGAALAVAAVVLAGL